MIAPARLYNFLREKGIDFYTGVPDSLLKYFLKYLHDNAAENGHVITANEGLAVGLAAGRYFATGKLPLVYLQNSGLGNLVNPLTSLADREMYAVPMLLLVGWRGRPGVKDEPQHTKMGRVTIPMLEVLEVPVYHLEADEKKSFEKINKAAAQAMSEQRPVALLVPEDIFETYEGKIEQNSYQIIREDAIRKILDALNGNETVICTTGKTGREFYELNLAAGKKISRYLLSAGAMGHANHIALGINMQGNEKVILLDGDGAVLMHMGSLSTIGHHSRRGLIHIVINNGSHESVGGQPTEGFFSELCGVAKACGYQSATCINNEEELEKWISVGLDFSTTQFVEIRTNKQSRKDLGRPKGNPVEWKDDFMKS